jgi:hypothetical protein
MSDHVVFCACSRIIEYLFATLVPLHHFIPVPEHQVQILKCNKGTKIRKRYSKYNNRHKTQHGLTLCCTPGTNQVAKTTYSEYDRYRYSSWLCHICNKCASTGNHLVGSLR